MEGQPWFAHYETGVPRTLAPYPHKTLADYVADTALQWPDHPAPLPLRRRRGHSLTRPRQPLRSRFFRED
jgi:hypothetical protein